MVTSGQDQIRGWKEIAAYFDRDERTVKRWEKQRALPVRRIPGAGRANVYMLVAEVEAWLASGASTAPLAEAPPQPEPPPTEPPIIAEPPAAGPALAAKPARTLPRLLLTAAALLLVTGIAVRARLFAGPASRLAASTARPAAPTDAQRKADALYLQGVYFDEQKTPASLDQARRSFEDAVHLDPTHARAFAGLANTFLLMREYATMPQEEAYTRARVAAQRAVALDPDLAEAHAPLGFLAFFASWNANEAAREFQTALRLNPDCALARHWYGSMLTHQGRYAEALNQLELAQQLEPTSAAIVASKAYALGLGGRRDEAIDLLQPLVSANPDAPSPHRVVANLSLLGPRDLPRYLEEMRRFATLRHNDEALRIFTAGDRAYRGGHEQAAWAAMFAEERRLSPGRATYAMVQAEAALGREDEALRGLGLLAAERNTDLLNMGIDPLLDPLRHDPRFQQILATVGLPRAVVGATLVRAAVTR